MSNDLAPVWQLPVSGAERTGASYINQRAKYHCFDGNTSLCGKYSQRTSDYDDGITVESGVILQIPHYACSVCYKRWKRKYLFEEEEK